MSVCIDEVLDYLDNHLVCQRCDGMGSLMEGLSWTWRKQGRDNGLFPGRPDRNASDDRGEPFAMKKGVFLHSF